MTVYPGVGLGQEVRPTATGVVGSALVVDGKVLFRTPPGEDKEAPSPGCRVAAGGAPDPRPGDAAMNSWSGRDGCSGASTRRATNIRAHWTPDGETWHPTKKGLSLSTDKLPLLLAALHRAAEVLGENETEPELLDEEYLTDVERAKLGEAFGLSPAQVDGEIFGSP